MHFYVTYPIQNFDAQELPVSSWVSKFWKIQIRDNIRNSNNIIADVLMTSEMTNVN